MRERYGIWSEDLGWYVGTFLGLGFFEQHVKDDDCSIAERPVEFESFTEADEFLESWCGGRAGCQVRSYTRSSCNAFLERIGYWEYLQQATDHELEETVDTWKRREATHIIEGGRAEMIAYIARKELE